MRVALVNCVISLSTRMKNYRVTGRWNAGQRTKPALGSYRMIKRGPLDPPIQSTGAKMPAAVE